MWSSITLPPPATTNAAHILSRTMEREREREREAVDTPNNVFQYNQYLLWRKSLCPLEHTFISSLGVTVKALLRVILNKTQRNWRHFMMLMTTTTSMAVMYNIWRRCWYYRTVLYYDYWFMIWIEGKMTKLPFTSKQPHRVVLICQAKSKKAKSIIHNSQ